MRHKEGGTLAQGWRLSFLFACVVTHVGSLPRPERLLEKDTNFGRFELADGVKT